MELKNEREVEVTREKLQRLETRYNELRHEQASDPLLRELTLRSYMRMINQMKEEILRFEARRREQAKIKV
jgi:hypothetical protein